jgi:hypothetical protein
LAFSPVFWAADYAHATQCLQPHEVAQLTTPLPNEDGSPNVQTINTCGGDDVSYQIPLSGPVMFYGTQYTSLYVTTNSVIAFGQPDGTYWTWPATPSISLFSMDWWAIPQQRTDEAFTIAHSHQGFQVTLKVRPFGNSGTAPLTTIVFTASYNQDRTLNLSYYADNVDQYSTRTGVVMPNGTQTSFESAGIEEEEDIPVVPGEPEVSDTTDRATEDTERVSDDTTRISEDTERTEDTDRISEDTVRPSDDVDREPSEPTYVPPAQEPTPAPVKEPVVEPSPEPSPSPTLPVEEKEPEPKPVKITEEILPEPETTPEPEPTTEPEPTPEVVVEESETEVPAFLASIPLIGDLAETVLDLFNDLNEVGSDMSPEARERAQEIVIVSIIVTQIVGVSAAAAIASTSRRK